MLEAIGSLITKTFDAFLKLNTKDARKRRLGKMLFEVYTGLGRVTVALENLQRDLPRYIGPKGDDALFADVTLPEGMVLAGWSSDKGYQVSLRHFDINGQMHVSNAESLSRQQILALAIRRHISDFSEGVHQFVRPLSHEAWEWFQLGHQPERLQALGIYDSEIVHVYTRAWFEDGGFVEALRGLGFEAEFSSKVIRLVDATFDPQSSPHGYAVKPSTRVFDLTKPDDVSEFLHRVRETQVAANDARQSLKQLLNKHFSLDDFL